MEPAKTTTEEQMLLRYAGTCRLCRAELPARQEAIYKRASQSVRCVERPAAVVASVHSNRSRRLPRVEWPAPRRNESTSAGR